MDVPENIASWRKAQRAELIARRLAVPDDMRDPWTAAITRSLVDGFPMLRGLVVGFCWPYKGEVDPRFAIRELRRHGARAALPAVVQKAAPLQFREWAPGVAMTRGVFDLPVPDGAPVLDPEALLMPPIGFDRHAYRLGYGGGYFDRTLAALKATPLKIGIAFEASRIDTIFPQPHDIPMDFVVTERGIHHAGARGLEVVTDLSELNALVRDLGIGRA